MYISSCMYQYDIKTAHNNDNIIIIQQRQLHKNNNYMGLIRGKRFEIDGS